MLSTTSDFTTYFTTRRSRRSAWTFGNNRTGWTRPMMSQENPFARNSLTSISARKIYLCRTQRKPTAVPSSLARASYGDQFCSLVADEDGASEVEGALGLSAVGACEALSSGGWPSSAL